MTTFCSHFLCTMKSHSVGEGGRRKRDGGEREETWVREERAKEEEKERG